jgi:Poly(ADP-ribose) polymerase and DNA-Ligase Zn-finger region
VPHVFESAPSGRSKCRGCGRSIAKGEVRFGEQMPNPFGDGDMTMWFHPWCAAYKRPEALLGTLASTAPPADRDALEQAAKRAVQHPRLQRIDGAERATSGRAGCRHCKEPIERGGWRIKLVFFEDGRFQPGGFVHLDCRTAYFECDGVLEPVLHFSPGLDEAEQADLRSAFARAADPSAS